MTIPGSILVVRLGAIGDVTNALVLATALRDAAPGTRVGWAVHPLARPLVEDHPAVDRVHVWSRGEGRAGWKKVVRSLRAERYELAVDLQAILKSAALARASGASRVVGFGRGRAKEMSWLLTRERVAVPPGRPHRIDEVLAVARHLGIPDPTPRRELPADPAAAEWARAVVEGLGAAPILVNLGASKPPNRWPPDRFGRLAAECARRHGPVVLTGGPEDRPAADVARAQGSEGVTDLVGGTSLRQLYHLMDRSRLFVGCDTGPMHLAAARELPVVALFGPADPARTGPWGRGHRVVRGSYRDEGATFRPGRMRDIALEAVSEAVAEVLSG